jgi:hypothetical protein
MRFRKRRVRRIRDELRQWLRSCYGLRARYAQVQIDAGRRHARGKPGIVQYSRAAVARVQHRPERRLIP